MLHVLADLRECYEVLRYVKGARVYQNMIFLHGKIFHKARCLRRIIHFQGHIGSTTMRTVKTVFINEQKERIQHQQFEFYASLLYCDKVCFIPDSSVLSRMQFETEVCQEIQYLTLVTLTFDLENQPSTSPNG